MITPYSNTISVTTEKFPFAFTVKTDNGGVSSSTQFRMPLTTSTGLNINVDWGDGSPVENITDHTLAIHTYASAGTYPISVTGDLLGWRFANGGDKLKMLEITSWETLTISVDQGFFGCTNLTCSATDAPLITSTSLFDYFRFCTNFNGNIGNWDVSNITNVQRMFDQANAFNNGGSASIGNWDTSNFTQLYQMFESALSFNQDISDWNVQNVISGGRFMFGKSSANYNPQYLGNIYTKWSLQIVQPNVTFDFGNILYSQSGEAGKDILENTPNNWILNDGGVLRNEIFEFSVKTDNAGVSSSTQFRMPLTSSTSLYFTVNWGDGSPVEIITNHTLAIHTYASAGTYTISTVGNLRNWAFGSVSGGGDRLKILNISQWAGLNINISNAFNGCANLNATATDAPLITSQDLELCFFGCANFDGAIGNWDVSNVNRMFRMFQGATIFNQDISTKTINAGQPNEYIAWDVSNVNANLDMYAMFRDANAFNNGDSASIGNWDTSNVQYMGDMFINAFAFNQDIGSWDISNVVSLGNFMQGKTAANYSAANLDSIYNGWSSRPVKPNLSISFGSIKYSTAGTIGKNRLLNSPNNWVISDGGQLAPFEFTVKTDNAGVSSSTEFRMPLTTSTNLGFTVNWGDGSPLETITDHTLAVHDYGVAGTYTITVTGAILGWSFNNGGDRLKMLNVLKWSGLNISVANGFYGCTNLTASATDAPLITSTSLQNYFNSCNNFNGEINNWDVSNVTSMVGMFAFNTGFNKYIGDWDTSSVENMVSMFLNNTGFNQNINTKIVNAGQPNEYVAWNTSNVTNMSFMFYQSNFNQPIGAWDVSSVTTMREMFFRAYVFNQDIGAWNVSNVTDFANWMSGKTNLNYSAQNLASIYNQWSQLTLKPNITINFNTIDYCDTAEANKQSIVTNFGWNITDGNAVPC